MNLADEIRYAVQMAGLTRVAAYHGVLRRTAGWVDPEGHMEHRVSQMLGKAIIEHLGLPVDLRGQEHAKYLEHYAVVCNHQSYLDWAVLLGYMPFAVRFIAKKELTPVPVVGSFLKRRGILIDRKAGEDAKAAIKRAAYDDSEYPILIFAEGTRAETHELRPFKRGGMQILAEAGLTMLPVAIAGTHEALPKGGRLVDRSRAIAVRIGPPVLRADYDDNDAMIDEVERRVRDLYAEGRGFLGLD